MNKIEVTQMLRDSYKKMTLTKCETANELSVSEATVDRLRKNGQITSRKILGQIMFNIDEVARFLTD